MKHMWLGLITIIVALPSLSAFGSSRVEVSNAVVMVAVRGKAVNGESINRNGTGFVVGNSRYVVTAKHVIATPQGGWGKTELDLPDVTIAIRFRDQTGIMMEARRAQVRIPAVDHDAALLEFDG